MKRSPARFLHLSNLVTYLSLLAALAAVLAVKEYESASLAGGFIALSVLADTLDGRFARRFRRDEDQARFGAQLDSLADGLSFGLAPVACIYLLLSFDSAHLRWAWYGAAFFYVISTLTRLGFYNIGAQESSDFIGVPAPVSGLVWSTYLLTSPSVGISMVILILCAISMIYPIRVPRPVRMGLLAFLGWPATLMILHWAPILVRPESLPP